MGNACGAGSSGAVREQRAKEGSAEQMCKRRGSSVITDRKIKRHDVRQDYDLGKLRAPSTRRASVSHSLIRAAPIPIYYSNSTITPGHRNEAHGLVPPHGPLRERLGDADLGRRHRGHARRGGARGGDDGVKRLPPAKNLPPLPRRR